MYRFYIFLLALLIAVPVTSADIKKPNQWVRVKDNVVFESPSDTTAAGYTVNLQLSYDHKMVIELIVRNVRSPESSCELTQSDELINIWDVNGRVINYHGKCVNGIGILVPDNPDDIKYVIDEFLTKSLVHVGPVVIVTKGFIEAYGEILRYASYME